MFDGRFLPTVRRRAVAQLTGSTCERVGAAQRNPPSNCGGKWCL